MSFLYPFFLFALLAVAIPIIIHLFNFKRFKTVYFSNVQLLKLVRKESQKKTQLKQLFILLSRILAIVALVFAFSRPFIPLSTRSSNAAWQVVAIYIDNTFSMKSEGENGQLLEQARQKAIEIANSYRVGTQFLLLTADLLPQHQFLLNKEQFVQQITEIKESPRSPRIQELYQESIRNISRSAKKAEKTLYVLSDFQKSSFDFDAIRSDSSVYTYLLPFKSEKTNNLLVDSCWFDVPGRKIGQQEKLFVRIKNLSIQAYQNIPIRLIINDSLKAVSNMNIAGEEQIILELNYTNNSEGHQFCKVELDDYPIIYDNSYFFSYSVRGKLQALGITTSLSNSSEFLKALFNNDELIAYDEFSENNFQISKLKNYQCLFLYNNQKISSGFRNELVSFVKEGGSLVIFPNRKPNVEEYNELLHSLNGKTIIKADTASMGISEINYDHEIYRDVFKIQENEADLPIIKGFLNFSEQNQRTETVLLKFRNGNPALSVHPFGSGKVYTFAFSLDQTNFNFVRHVLFVPTIYNMVLNSGERQIYAWSIENEDPILIHQSTSQNKLKIVNSRTKEEFVTESRTIGQGKKQLLLDDMPKEAGHFLVMDDAQPIQSISYNFSRKESIPEYYNDDDLKKLIERKGFEQFQVIQSADLSFSETLQDLNNGKQLWKHFIVLSILFLFFEMAIIRFWK